MQFTYEAMRADGTTVQARLEAGGRSEAVEAIRGKGLILLKLNEQAGAPAEASAAGSSGGGRVATRDLILFTRQMQMLLESGSPLVPALEATEQQSTRPAVRTLVRRLRERVEEGASLAEAMEPETRHFDAVFRSMISAGEATGALPEVFGRLNSLAQQQQQTRKMVIGAMTYPAILSLMLLGVVVVLLTFVVPRFESLFNNLDSPLPSSTKLLFGASAWFRQGWPIVLGVAVIVVVTIVLCWRLPGPRQWLDNVLVRLPVVGRLAARLIFARVVRIWAAMLRCHVPLLEAIQQSRNAVTNAAFTRLLVKLEEDVASGGRLGEAIGRNKLADPVIASAIRTGEENGRLAEATDFVSTWVDDDNASMVAHVTRMAEPSLLAVMGVVVGFVAMSLFLPLFDIATAAG